MKKRDVRHEVRFYRATHNPDKTFREEKREEWTKLDRNTAHGKATIHLDTGGGYKDTFSELYSNHLAYAKQEYEKPPTIPQMLRALADWIEADAYRAEVTEFKTRELPVFEGNVVVKNE